MKDITDKQREVLDYIRQYRREHKYSPVIREIAKHFDISVKAAYDQVRALHKKGAISITQGVSRSIVPVEE